MNGGKVIRDRYLVDLMLRYTNCTNASTQGGLRKIVLNSEGCR